jgi:hypothetical protein
MQPISRVACEVFGASGMDQALRMPATTTANQTVLAAAGAMAEAAHKEKEVFVKRGRKAVRLLNAILQPRLVKDPELLAAC